MSTVMIILLLGVLAVIAVSLMLGRVSYEVESARDTEYVELEGHWVRYEVTGGGPPVLLVHGWLSSAGVWEPLIRRLARRFTVYTLDLTGFGASDKPTDGYGVRYGSRLLYAFCAHFGLTRTAVIGHDIGGAMAVKLAADHPDIVGRLVLVATPADEDQVDLPTLLWLTTLPGIGAIFYALGRSLRPVRRFWMRSFVVDPADLPDGLVEDAGRSTPAAASRTYNAVRQEISGGRLARQARIIKVPVLLVAGEEDQVVDPRAVGDWGQNVTQAEIALLGGCGHLPMVEAPSEFGARVMAFLTGDSGYLEHVREVPPPADQEPAPAETPPEPAEPAGSSSGAEERPAAERASFGDLVWDFDPGRPATPRPDPVDPVDAGPRKTPPTEEGEPRPAAGVSRRWRPDGVDNPDTPESRDAAKDEEAAERTPDGARRFSGPRTRQAGGRELGGGRVPEFPGDLFQWSEPPGEFRPGRRYRREKGRAEGDDARGDRE